MKWMIASITGLALAGLAIGAPADEVQPLADAFDQAQLKSDGEALARFLADDMVFIRGSGKVGDKAYFVRSFTTPDVKIEPFKLEDRRFVELAPDVVAATANVELKGMDGKEPFDEHIRYSDIWSKKSGAWQVVYVQVTRLAQ